VSFYVSTATFFLLHCDEWDRVVALPRHKFDPFVLDKMWLLFKEEFEDTKEVIRIRISKKNRQHNGQKEKEQNNYL
jgi:hypothetical protein